MKRNISREESTKIKDDKQNRILTRQTNVKIVSFLQDKNSTHAYI
jgi:hypothetical protein